MLFYEIRDDQWESSRYAWADGYGPIESMPFLHPTHMQRRREYWKVNPEKPGICIAAKGSVWPDLLGNAHMPPQFFVSERVIESLTKYEVPLGRLTEMPIAEINAKALKNKPAPRYFVVETIPGIEVDLVATGFKLDTAGKAIVNPAPKPWPSPYRFRASSWNGSDLFSYRHFGPTDGPYTEMFCTERVKELAEREGWTNVRFKPLALV